ncbi:hypothetical protein HU200_058452 [Digitaria exilis]|uniref:Uncharacterized protein n=1 Tax=Digitaria exilis TaxID=1010633 RepID=A0A835ADH5_9POAL|nr:hypothetical protein HU200_058452 [Digitaria exilis]
MIGLPPAMARHPSPGAQEPFEYVKGDDGRTVIKATSEFLIGTIASLSKDGKEGEGDTGGEAECAGVAVQHARAEEALRAASGCREGRAWLPRLDTIKERKGRMQRSQT